MHRRIAAPNRIAFAADAEPRWAHCNWMHRNRSLRKAARTAAVIFLSPFFVLSAMSPTAGALSAPPQKKQKNSIWQLAQTDPVAIMRKVSQNELDNSYGHRAPLRYELRRKTRNTDTTKIIVETAKGGVARLIAIDNKPLTASQKQAETQRLRELSADPALQEHRRRSEQKDADRISEIMRLLPEAFLYKAVDMDATKDTIHLTFEPNPHFSPPTLESRILTGVRGDVWIDAHDLRVIRIESHIFKNIEYGWGILATLYPGGDIRIEQAKTPDCGWQFAYLDLDLTGKKFMFRQLRIVLQETATGYAPVQSNWNYTSAIQWLLHMPIPALEQSESQPPSVQEAVSQ